MDFLWHKVSEEEKKEIQKQAKLIMDNFSEKLFKIKENLEDFSVDRENGNREEGSAAEAGFSKEIMFKNSKENSKGFIITEKKSW